MRSVRLISLPDHARPGVSTWPPHYAAVRDWLKSKGVSALTDRSGVVYYTIGMEQDGWPTVLRLLEES